MLAMCLHSGRLLRHGLAPFLGSGLALLPAFWRLPAQTPALALPSPLSSPRNTIPPLPLPTSPEHILCLLHIGPHLLSASGDLESFLNSEVGARAWHKPYPIPENANFETKSFTRRRRKSCLCSSLTSSRPPTSRLTHVRCLCVSAISAPSEQPLHQAASPRLAHVRGLGLAPLCSSQC